MIYDLVKENEPLLKTRVADWVFSGSFIPETTVLWLRETMEHYDALGLAANQCGLGIRVFVCKDIYAVFNPEILRFSEEKSYDEEGCLSFPRLWVNVKRSDEIDVRYQNIDGDTVTETLRGLNARIFQHETDHLNGITFLDRATRYHRDLGMKRRKNNV